MTEQQDYCLMAKQYRAIHQCSAHSTEVIIDTSLTKVYRGIRY